MSALAEKIEQALIADPFATSKDIGERMGLDPSTIRSTVKYRWKISFTELQREVFDGYWQRIPEDAA